jgi:uncharacterized protein (DUF305 family)
MKRIFHALAVAVVAGLALTACGGGRSSGNGSGDFDSADVTFAQSMIPHHKQAVEMAKMAKAHASSSKVKQLADRIEAAQGPEIATMQGWLKTWGKSASKPSMAGMNGGGSGMAGMPGMPGMMSKAEMTSLDKAVGPAFDKMFLTMMINHHRGAIDMAKTELTKGKNADAKALAKDIEKAQTKETTEMKNILGS